MTDLLDISDEIARARHMVSLIQMTCAIEPDDDQKAIAEGCDAALERLDAALKGLSEINRAAAKDLAA
ncbi:hypothetical protein ROJ8625_00693 [Roseivivax jejudonensis]|uniref:Uncharacterized protein n=1 Tax=Roseivivax jejudonensis TaxID=1529041 RepID=A0A1X6YG31_9RHOB|nr:hypothetical protein [Roseivivax jejudonensis]SLN19808.1 hypothetical protein ROJ8625_00693 [Roseivivax jejudonensis]